jgi:hypothetical protein
MPRMLRSAVSASRRVFDAQWRCAADPRSIVHSAPAWVQLCGASSPDDAARRRENAAPRPENTERIASRRNRPTFTAVQDKTF